MKRIFLCGLALVSVLGLTACNKKAEAETAPAIAPTPVNIEQAGATPDQTAPPPTATPEAEVVIEKPAAPTLNEDPVSKLQRQEMEELNRGLQTFIAKNQRLPKDLTELAQSINTLPLPPLGSYWIIDPASKTIKLAKRK